MIREMSNGYSNYYDYNFCYIISINTIDMFKHDIVMFALKVSNAGDFGAVTGKKIDGTNK